MPDPATPDTPPAHHATQAREREQARLRQQMCRARKRERLEAAASELIAAKERLSELEQRDADAKARQTARKQWDIDYG